MVTFVFLLFVGMFAVAGFFISLEAKRRGDGQARLSLAPRNGDSKTEQSAPGRKNSESPGTRAA
jgi:hypothetical protein